MIARRRPSGGIPLIGLLVAACGGADGDADTTADTVRAAATPVAEPIVIDADRFAQLRWLEGTWRGSGEDQPTFYERYTFVDDSTIRAESASDSTFPRPDEASHIALRGGVVITGDDAYEWAVTSLDARSVRFDPTATATNAFTWTSESDSAWTARLTWTASDGQAHERVYRMRRMQ